MTVNYSVPQSAARVDWVIEQGATFYHGVQWVSRDPDTDIETPYQLHGYTARMQIRLTPEMTDADPVMTLTTENDGLAIYDEDLGIITILISAEDTAAITWGKAYYDLELIAPASTQVYRLIFGEINISREVTY